jgi:hypothetical protein
MVAALLILVFIVRLVWGWQAGRMLQQQLDAAKARGEPVYVEDVKFQTLPDSEDAWKLRQKYRRQYPRIHPPKGSRIG